MRMDLDKTVTKQEIEAAVRRILSQWNRCENNFQREVLYRSLMNVHYSEPFDWSLVVQLNVLEAEFQKTTKNLLKLDLQNLKSKMVFLQNRILLRDYRI